MASATPPDPLSERLARLRDEYTRAGLDESQVAAEPLAQLGAWLNEALSAGVPEANAATLATASPDGVPNARIVLLKGIDARGVTFFTNYESAKGRELTANPRAAVVIFWRELERQVRIAGDVERVSRAESEAYFHSRPRGSQLGAWASRQSTAVSSRGELDAQMAQAEKRFEGSPVPLPDSWGGYRLVPRVMELWQGRPSRMHDRLRYAESAPGRWTIERLSP
jgi:pyridoxamine 5'-phosphate oxidase